MIWFRFRELPYGPQLHHYIRKVTRQMAASDYAPTFFKNRLNIVRRTDDTRSNFPESAAAVLDAASVWSYR